MILKNLSTFPLNSSNFIFRYFININIGGRTLIQHNLLRPHYAVCIMHDRWLRDRRVQVNGARSM